MSAYIQYLHSWVCQSRLIFVPNFSSSRAPSYSRDFFWFWVCEERKWEFVRWLDLCFLSACRLQALPTSVHRQSERQWERQKLLSLFSLAQHSPWRAWRGCMFKVHDRKHHINILGKQQMRSFSGSGCQVSPSVTKLNCYIIYVCLGQQLWSLWVCPVFRHVFTALASIPTLAGRLK